MFTLALLPYMIPNSKQTERILSDEHTGVEGSMWRRWQGIDDGNLGRAISSDEGGASGRRPGDTSGVRERASRAGAPRAAGAGAGSVVAG